MYEPVVVSGMYFGASFEVVLVSGGAQIKRYAARRVVHTGQVTSNEYLRRTTGGIRKFTKRESALAALKRQIRADERKRLHDAPL